MKEGHFIAHQFHFLMRQYSLALYEVKRMLYDREEKSRKLEEYRDKLNNGDNTVTVIGENGAEEKYTDIEIGRLNNEIDLLEITMTNKIAMVTYFEKARKKIIELNDGKPPTNAQHQKEEPEYWKWYLQNRMIWQAKEIETGVHEGVWENIDHLEQPYLLNPDYQIMVLDKNGMVDFGLLEKELELNKNIPDRVQNILSMQNQ